MKDLARRLPTTVVLLAFAYAAIEYLPSLPFAVLLYAIVSAAVFEFVRLSRPRRYSLPLMLGNGALIAFAFLIPPPPAASALESPLALALAVMVVSYGLYFLFALRGGEELEHFVRDLGVHFLSSLYLFFPLFFIWALREVHPHLLFYLIVVIAVGDSGAYFVGSAIGRRKIYPLASPKKSLEGLLAGILTAAAAGWLAIVVFPLAIAPWRAMLTGAALGWISQLSDPVESLFKRAAGVKDSGAWLPGHGGVLDRLDSYIFCAPALMFIQAFFWRG